MSLKVYNQILSQTLGTLVMQTNSI